ncbi:response regulator [Sphingobacterium prati]|uniref:response regulator n=1 Tax=Sphingobacterium prati TaxID=2737006 RepID=UPI001552D4F5|nr:response regulator [Sphingobacterium prati]NPE46458.1 response regulator [Sphingobacterium prati]
MNQENKRKVILIDDNAILRTIFGYIVQGFPDYPIEFHPFENALDFLESHDISVSPKPALLFVDISMPLMTGWELMEVLKDKRDFVSQSEIFIISSSSSQKDQEQLVNYPFISGFILKPFGKEVLYKILRRAR